SLQLHYSFSHRPPLHLPRSQTLPGLSVARTLTSPVPTTTTRPHALAAATTRAHRDITGRTPQARLAKAAAQAEAGPPDQVAVVVQAADALAADQEVEGAEVRE